MTDPENLAHDPQLERLVALKVPRRESFRAERHSQLYARLRFVVARALMQMPRYLSLSSRTNRS